jgi:hypothetical protein
MKNWELKNIERSIFEKTGLIPRSILRIFENFKNQLDPNREQNVLEQLRVSRYQALASLRYIFILIITPLFINLFSTIFIFGPLINYCWKKQNLEIFLNSSQQLRALEELQTFEEKLRFEILIGKQEPLSVALINTKIKNKANQLARQYTEESKSAIKNILGNTLATSTMIPLILNNRRQLSILTSVFNEVLYGLSDTAKSFFIILFTDIFVGYHSSHGWEILLETLLRHFGLAENREFIFLFIATFPVVLDTVFKYWIFRYLNRVSPSAVATYRNMNE